VFLLTNVSISSSFPAESFRFRFCESLQRNNIKYLDEVINYRAQRGCNERVRAKLEFHAVLSDVFVSFCRSRAARALELQPKVCERGKITCELMILSEGGVRMSRFWAEFAKERYITSLSGALSIPRIP
jgi:hypothetical protein